MKPTYLAVQFQHSRPFAAGTFAKVRIIGPLVNIGFWWSLGFDIRYTNSRLGLANVKSTPHSTNVPVLSRQARLLTNVRTEGH